MQIKNERPKKENVKKKTLYFRLNRILVNLFNLFYRKGLNYHALNSEDSLQMLLKTKKSYIRFSNGESEIILGLNRGNQTSDKELRKSLIKIIKDYSPHCNYLLGLSNWRLSLSIKELKALNIFKMWRFMRYIFWKLDMDKINMPFLESDMFRVGPVGLKREYIELLWANIPNIIMIHHSEKYFKWFCDENRNKNVYFVKIPDMNFFSVLPETQEKTINLIRANNIDKSELVILVAAGPGAKVFCYNLCQKDNDFLCYDIGHFFHMHYHEALTK